MHRSLSPLRLAVVSSFVAILLIPLAAYATSPATLQACVNVGNGNMRLVADASACHANETFVQWNVTGPQGPAGPAGAAGPQGPAGPAGSSAGGPPYVWVCTPVNWINAGTTSAALQVFNAGSSSANVAINFLDKDGNNLVGVTVPGSAPANPGDPLPVWPGQANGTTVPLASANSMVVKFYTGQGDVSQSGSNLPTVIRVTSDQPIGVGAVMQWSGFVPLTCHQIQR